MGYGDWIFLGVLLVMALLGVIVGFGKGLSFFAGKVTRVIVAVILCYFFGGVILKIPFVSTMLEELASKWAHIGFLAKIHLELIIYYIVLALIFMLLLFLTVKLIDRITDSDVPVINVVNRIGGALLFVAAAFVIILLVFQIIMWIGGNTAESFYNSLAANANCIVRPIYEHNPASGIVNFVKDLMSH